MEAIATRTIAENVLEETAGMYDKVATRPRYRAAIALPTMAYLNELDTAIGHLVEVTASFAEDFWPDQGLGARAWVPVACWALRRIGSDQGKMRLFSESYAAAQAELYTSMRQRQAIMAVIAPTALPEIALI